MALFSMFPSLLDLVSHKMHIYYTPSLLFLVGLLFSLVFHAFDASYFKASSRINPIDSRSCVAAGTITRKGF